MKLVSTWSKCSQNRWYQAGQAGRCVWGFELAPVLEIFPRTKKLAPSFVKCRFQAALMYQVDSGYPMVDKSRVEVEIKHTG